MEQPRPNHLYRYRSLADGPSLKKSPREWTRQIFQNNKLYFPTIAQCNDPFEGLYTLSFDAPFAVRLEGLTEILRQNTGMAEERAREQARETLRSGATERVSPQARQKVRDTILHKAPILSLVARKNDILMWSHYADAHHGICIEFDLEADPKFFEDVRPVCYREHLPCLNLWQDSPQKKAEKSCLTKSCHWSYEEEWRIIDMRNGPQVKPFAPEAISAVILGCRISENDERMVRAWIQDRSREVEVSRANPKDDVYEIDL